MHNPYDLHSWSKHYREEALREARKRDLVERARRSWVPKSVRDRVSLVWNSVLSVARRVALSG